MSQAIERFIPRAEIRVRHETVVHAPPGVVFDVARSFDIQSIPLVRAIFWLRAKLLGGPPPANRPKGLVAEAAAPGWGVLAERPGRELVMGAVAQPWLANVMFTAVPPTWFAAFADPEVVKIVWTWEAEPDGLDVTRLATETRVQPTDDAARAKFRRYWRVFGIGIVLIRWLVVPAVRREAERRYRFATGAPPGWRPRTAGP